MISVETFQNKQVAVFGLGGSGLVCAEALMAGGAQVIAWDDGEVGRAAASERQIPLQDLRNIDWSEISALVLAPGVPLTHPEPHWSVKLAKAAGVEVIGDMELFARERQAHYPHAATIAITGTNGKSTTTALIAHVLAKLGVPVEMGGNIGKAVLTLSPAAPDRVHVLEVSSYQIDLAPNLQPTVGVLLNITPDHIDRHGTIENYADVKRRMISHATRAVVGLDDALTKVAAEKFGSQERVYPITIGKGAAIVPRFYAIGSTIFEHTKDGAVAQSEQLADLANSSSLRGAHNVQNALAALAVVRALQDEKNDLAARAERDPSISPWTFPDVWQPDKFQDVLDSFPGLPHRMEEVARSQAGVVFINDSKATNAEATAKALSAFESDIFWIVGGLSKEGGITSLEGDFPRIKKAFLIGEAGEDFAATLAGHVDYQLCGTLDVAVAAAVERAELRAKETAGGASASTPVVLFSPACASFDQFKNFEVRGDAFRDQVLRCCQTAGKSDAAT